jgi:serine/threonine-protein kinase
MSFGSGLPDLLARSLGESYRIDGEFSGGGMSRVFTATDMRLARDVVVKVLPPEAAHAVSIDRFKREIALAARLQHPHIVPLLSAGDADGLPYFLMPFVEGETLRARIARDGELPLGEILRLLRELTSALAYAHRKGIVHRDIKPENILLTANHAVITDFGVAKALRAATSDGLDGLTSMGVVIGTPAYMAPEQAAGDPDIDHRADLYALGLVAYEMISGRAPFFGRSARATIAAQLVETPPAVTSSKQALPAALAALVMRCLAKGPDDRPQDAEEILRELDHITLPSPRRRVDRPSVAVLPMANTGGDVEDEHFSDGLTDELISALSSVRALSVCGRTSVFALKGKQLDVRTIADMLHVEHVLEGSVRRAGNRLKVRVQLVDDDGNVRWSDGFDRTFTDVFDVQEEIAQAVARALQVQLAPSPEPLVRPPTTDMAAYELFLKGRALRRRFTPQDIERAIVYFEQAIARDPNYALAMAWLSDSHVLLSVIRGRPTAQTMQLARTYAERAVAIDGDRADAHWALGQVRMCFDWNWPMVDEAYRRALTLDPGHVDARHLLGLSLLHQGRFEESAAQLHLALKTDPLLAEAHGTLSRLYQCTGRSEQAVNHALEALDLNPHTMVVRISLGYALLQLGRVDEGLAEFARAAREAHGSLRELAALAHALVQVGRREEAVAHLDALVAQGADEAIPYQMAVAYAGLGNLNESFRLLGRAVDDRDPWISFVKVDPACAPLRRDAQYVPLLRRIGLEP